MRVLLLLLVLALLIPLIAQEPAPTLAASEEKEKEAEEVDFICPMDPEVRTKGPGKCPRCGMKLVAGIADLVEFPVNLRLSPRLPRPGKPVDMTFRVEDPKTGAAVKKFEIVHEKLFHLFLVSEDLRHFSHEHPEFDSSGAFRFRWTFPAPGPYRVLTDFYPAGATPQMHVSTLYVAGKAQERTPLKADLSPQKGANLEVELVTEPPQPLAGFKTLMFFRLKPTSGEWKLEPYLGAWGHMLAASEDLIDLVHTHPFLADGGPQVQFNLIFPREGTYRVWVQFQNGGEVNTVAFNVPVQQLR